jgi:hypothetical protein
LTDHPVSRIDIAIETTRSIAADAADVPKILTALHYRHERNSGLRAADAEPPARIMDRLSEECHEAAGMIRALAGGE